MDLRGEVEQLRASLRRAEQTQTELDRRVFHLKTLYDVSKDIFGSVESDRILRNFLLMTMGNFGTMEGFILTLKGPSQDIDHFVSMGFQENDHLSLRDGGRQLLLQGAHDGLVISGPDLSSYGFLPSTITCALPFSVASDSSGFLGLGGKITGEPYSDDDRELLLTLMNNLVVALKSARSFEEIKRLNQDLQEKNIQLEKALNELQAALRKVEILESVKANLSKFVPTTVSRLLDKSPTSPILDTKERDVSILFLDIEGYTKISESLGVNELNQVIEKCFSVFIDAIHENNGDVMEAAGDGLMVLFLSEEEKANALEAVRTANMIREKTAIINQEFQGLSQPLLINMGINSGQALVGAAKFESYTGSRWTFTARGMVTNVAARIGAFASGGTVLLSRSTADRVKEHFPSTYLGSFRLKNISEEVEIFEV